MSKSIPTLRRADGVNSVGGVRLSVQEVGLETVDRFQAKHNTHILPPRAAAASPSAAHFHSSSVPRFPVITPERNKAGHRSVCPPSSLVRSTYASRNPTPWLERQHPCWRDSPRRGRTAHVVRVKAETIEFAHLGNVCRLIEAQEEFNSVKAIPVRESKLRCSRFIRYVHTIVFTPYFVRFILVSECQ